MKYYFIALNNCPEYILREKAAFVTISGAEHIDKHYACASVIDTGYYTELTEEEYTTLLDLKNECTRLMYSTESELMSKHNLIEYVVCFLKQKKVLATINSAYNKLRRKTIKASLKREGIDYVI